MVLDAWLGETAARKWAAGRCGLAVPRQNGKNAILEMVELYKMVALGRKLLHTAHEVKTARKAFLRLRGFFENTRKYPELAALVKEIRSTNGQEAIVLHAAGCPAREGAPCECDGGGSCEFVARSRGSARGFTVDDLVCDEAQELTDEQLEALLPTISAAPSGNPQQTYVGTPPGPGSPGTVFARIRKLGVGGKDKRLAWVEWSFPASIRASLSGRPARDVPALQDMALVAAANPAFGIRLHPDVVRDELGAMTDAGFARERGGLWAADDAEESVISREAWLATGVTEVPTDGYPSYGVKFSPDGSTVALAASRSIPRGPVHVELIERRSTSSGIAWLVSWISERWRDAAQITVDGKAHAGNLVAALRDAGVPARVLVMPTVEQVTTAHSMLAEAVTAGTVTTFADPGQSTLVDSIASSARRPIGTAGGWGFRPIANGECTSAESAVLAHWGAKTSKRRPGRRQRAVIL